MLVSLSIKNYALIHDLTVDFWQGFSIITGETGAGKSILLGGLALVLGKRADSSLVYDKERKCVVEARFDVKEHNLHSFFEQHDLDYDDELILRRELLSNGKSRAFVNDTPANLSVLSLLSERIIDIHSQHETLQLADRAFQFHIVDSMAGNSQLLGEYKKKYTELEAVKKELTRFREEQDQARLAYDYNSFMYQELSEAELIEGEQEELEESLEKLSHADEIKTVLSEVNEIAERESFGLNEILSSIRLNLAKISKYSDAYAKISERWESFCIEARDLMDEIESENDELLHDPAHLERVELRLHQLYGLQKKHNISDVKGLLELKNGYLLKLSKVDDADAQIDEKEKIIQSLENELWALSVEISNSRKAVLPSFTKQMEELLAGLEMKNTKFNIGLIQQDRLMPNGADQLEFLISSDKGRNFETIKRIASGGEMSRIMLAVKYILSNYTHLPAIVFDEIDSGVSGEVSNRIADLMARMSENMQVISITHLPQVAAKGVHHYLVYKEDNEGIISSNIRLLDEADRLVHLAEMLGGNEITESALAHARQLLS